MSLELLKKIARRAAAELAHFVWLLFLATLMGGFIGALMGRISDAVSGGEQTWVTSFGAVVGAITGFSFYIVVHWFVFRMPLDRVATFLIGGTFIGSLPLAFIPEGGAVLSLFGGVVGYWLGLVLLLMRRWFEKRDERKNDAKQPETAKSPSAL